MASIRTTTVWFLAVLAVANAALAQEARTPPAPAAFHFYSIAIPGASLTQPMAINNSEVIVGAYSNSLNNGFALRYRNLKTLDVPDAFTAVMGINSFNDIVGYYDAHEGTKNPKGFLFSNRVFTTIDVPGAFVTEPSKINDAGSIVGQYLSDGNSGGNQGFLYSGGTFTTLNFPGAAGTVARGINNAGQIVGVYTDSSDLGLAFIYSNGEFQQLVVPGCASSAAFGINNHGDIVGSCETAVGIFGFRDQAGIFTLFSFPGSSDTQPFGINDQGEIVGQYISGTTVNGFLAIPAAPSESQMHR